MTSPSTLQSPTPMRGPRGLWQAMVDHVVVPETQGPSAPGAAGSAFRVRPAEIRAIAFMASLGPTTPPARRGGPEMVEMVDLAGEEAFLGYLARVAVPPAS